jgi:DNA-binding transcriptional LysR family regulator
MAGIDLNLLAVLGALLEHRNVTRAGERLSLSQPTMSGALARLRQHFGDELLVRSGREYQLTPLADGLLPAVREALGQVERTLRMPAEFDPEDSVRRFSIAISAQSILALGGLLRRVHELAPRRAVRHVADHRRAAGDRPRPARIRRADRARGIPRGRRAGGALRDRVVYVADPANPRLRDGRDRFTAEDLAALPHAAARLPQADLITGALDELGVTPKVVATTGGWLPLPFLVAGTDLVAAVPERLARRVSSAAGVTITDPRSAPLSSSKPPGGTPRTAPTPPSPGSAASSTLLLSHWRVAGVSSRPTRSTIRLISYAMRPRSQSDVASTARLEPLLIDMTTNSPASISTAVWTTRPAWNTRAAPCTGSPVPMSPRRAGRRDRAGTWRCTPGEARQPTPQPRGPHREPGPRSP